MAENSIDKGTGKGYRWRYILTGCLIIGQTPGTKGRLSIQILVSLRSMLLTGRRRVSPTPYTPWPLPVGDALAPAQRLKVIGRQINISVSPHRLRHTFATQLLNVGCKVTSIQKLLGHTNLNTTMTYARAFDQTVMLDYFRAVDQIESQPEGA